MKWFAPISLVVAGMLAGCATNPPAPAAKPGAVAYTPAPAQIVTPDNSLMAKVASFSQVGRYVVLSFPIGQMPKPEQSLFLYRNGLKVAELKVTGPQRDNNIVADLLKGDVQMGDEVRDR
jgi:hypothetical protein